jgi:N-acetylmuramoyl-L-alanine amidase
MRRHVVKQRECLVSIARQYGFADPSTIYDDPGNEELRQKRPHPNVLFPGDEVVIPEPDTTTITIRTGKRTKLVATVARRELRLRLTGAGGVALANEPFTVEASGEVAGGTTDGAGLLVASVSGRAVSAVVTAAGLTWSVRLGALDPIGDTPDGGSSGALARLANLGFLFAGSPPPSPEALAAALRAFQREQGLEETGELDSATASKVQEAHGS